MDKSKRKYYPPSERVPDIIMFPSLIIAIIMLLFAVLVLK